MQVVACWDEGITSIRFMFLPAYLDKSIIGQKQYGDLGKYLQSKQ
jgi:hypothetical protein